MSQIFEGPDFRAIEGPPQLLDYALLFAVGQELQDNQGCLQCANWHALGLTGLLEDGK